MRPLHRLARRRLAPVITLLVAELERQPWFRVESQLAGGLRPWDLARRWGRREPRLEQETVVTWLLATTGTGTRAGRSSPASIGALLEAARLALRTGDDSQFSARLVAAEKEIERLHRRGSLSGAEADDWGDFAYLLVGWQARRAGHVEQVRDVLEAFEDPLPLERSLLTQARVLHFQAMAAADRGAVREARRLLHRAFDRLPNAALLSEIELVVDYTDVLAASNRRVYAAERLAETVALAALVWPPAVLVPAGLRAVELLASVGRGPQARAVADLVSDVATPEHEPEVLAARAEICLHAGAFEGARVLFESLRATAPRASEVSLAAGLGLARLTQAEGLEQEARQWARCLHEDVVAFPEEHPRRHGLSGALAALEHTDDLAATLADAHAWWRASRSAPALPFRQPFPGAVRVRVPLERLEDEEVPDFGNLRPAPPTIH